MKFLWADHSRYGQFKIPRDVAGHALDNLVFQAHGRDHQYIFTTEKLKDGIIREKEVSCRAKNPFTVILPSEYFR